MTCAEVAGLTTPFELPTAPAASVLVNVCGVPGVDKVPVNGTVIVQLLLAAMVPLLN